jgi:predicted 3-demethylubiquinone-9 3-methyltransferase (glyoxalase superfamily)
MNAPKPTPFFWFDGQVGAAAKFYCSIFKKARIVRLNGLANNIQTATVRLNGLEIILFNGGPHYKLTPAASLMVPCKTQREVDYYWKKLTAGGEESRCGWLVDRYGLSWQIVPEMLFEVLSDPDEAKAGRAMQAMLQMRKLDIKALRRAHAGR